MSQNHEVPIRTYWVSSSSGFGDYWLHAYGWISYYFAQIEGLSYALIDLLGNNDSKVRLKRLPFQERTEQAKILVCAPFKNER